MVIGLKQADRNAIRPASFGKCVRAFRSLYEGQHSLQSLHACLYYYTDKRIGWKLEGQPSAELMAFHMSTQIFIWDSQPTNMWVSCEGSWQIDSYQYVNVYFDHMCIHIELDSCIIFHITYMCWNQLLPLN